MLDLFIENNILGEIFFAFLKKGNNDHKNKDFNYFVLKIALGFGKLPEAYAKVKIVTKM